LPEPSSEAPAEAARLRASLGKEKRVTSPSVKERLLEVVRQLPPDATIEDAMERLYFLAKIDRGLAEADAGKTISHDEVKARFGL
jgi:predicted transcriptional regulator